MLWARAIVATSADERPNAEHLSQVFPVQTRYTGISLAYQTGTAVFARTTPMPCQYLYARTASVIPVILLGIAYTLLSVGSAIALLRRSSEQPTTAA
ncbi:hypothetical protein [Streptomyces sp. NPDC058297]|uniref:hypothetical protein n=1 Tax=Streptomyces sp. NPDC058297 TaxID=3346433 RepID=UPI0036EF99D3